MVDNVISEIWYLIDLFSFLRVEEEDFHEMAPLDICSPKLLLPPVPVPHPFGWVGGERRYRARWGRILQALTD